MKEKLLLLHGALGSKAQFKPLIPHLEDQYEVYKFNFDGHGGLQPTNPFTIELFSENTLDFLNRKGLSNINVFGYSMGGYVALYIASKHPALIRSIVTYGTKFDWDTTSSQREAAFLDPDKISLKVPQYAAKLKQEHTVAYWKGVVLNSADMMLRLGEHQPLSTDVLSTIYQQTHIGVGSQDKMVSWSESSRVVSLLPNCKLHKIEGAPHPIDQLNPNVLSNYIKAYV